MNIKTVSLDQAVKIFQKYGINIPRWTTCSVQVEGFDGMICDYSSMKAYTVKYACEVWDVNNNKQVERFNVMR